ncbi:1-pyrroline-5-carboxylate dehydrogenase [Tepiditoga spiralis]|uniref:L-glutamate gamma-semialdehyde dehydrogenase n=1 Tax=Tepiditoga spiralis TaxID=2108365 RepID=A0A7G1G215_9BACT|nr:L-glutamate gamma-semialdehyde dehydrogenase [Tepiditoga spiralis]BBE30350.1 1-pyrroline-5-carboxylate dehydrogenase [Tepiditoga spiralis]
MNSINLYEMPKNEPILGYLPGSKEKKELKEKLKELENKVIEIPAIIGGKEIKTGNTKDIFMPHDLTHKIATVHMLGEEEVKMAIESAMNAKKIWDKYTWQDRVSIFRRAAELLSTTWRSTLNAATMMCQSKNVFQAEIDSACELIDFFNFNSYYLTQLYKDQPISPKGIWNRVEYRPLEGFVFAVTPFNFSSIGGNLPTAPAIMGNTVLWKPARTQLYSAYFTMKLLIEAGVPEGVINFLPVSGSIVGEVVLKHPDLAGIHFTGSTGTFQYMWRTVGENISNYKAYPRIVGETGGKDFMVVHKSAEKNEVLTALIRGSFEYQGQKCSALSRAYIPESMWNEIKDELIEKTDNLKMGNPEDFTNFINAVIDKASFDKINSYIKHAKDSSDAEIIAGGKSDDTKGYFIRPTIIKTTNPHFKTMEEEIFGPVLTIYVYSDEKYEETLELCDKTSIYGLTGAVFAKDRNAILLANEKLVNAAGNFYINDKPTGAVVGQQPFGGARASGTNDKAGSAMNLLRWTSMRSVKENFNPPKSYEYGFMQEK